MVLTIYSKQCLDFQSSKQKEWMTRAGGFRFVVDIMFEVHAVTTVVFYNRSSSNNNNTTNDNIFNKKLWARIVSPIKQYFTSSHIHVHWLS
jgi:hypothetical protein